MKKVITVRFKQSGKTYYFDPAGMDIKTGDHVIVETARGTECAEVVQGVREVPDSQVVKQLKSVTRMADAVDVRRMRQNREDEKRAFKICEERIARHKLEMKLVDVEYTLDRSKILFYFIADGRIDFRELVKDLAGVFHTRIELRQIGVRDESKMLGGIGICGQVFCCSRFLKDFQPVSIKMAKEQGLSLNPAKISGACGRLMCCLRYEQAAYEDLVKAVPKVGAFVETPAGYGTVSSVNILRSSLKVKLDGQGEDVFKSYQADEIAVIPGGRPKPCEPLPSLLKDRPKPVRDEEPKEDPWALPQLFADDVYGDKKSDGVSAEQGEKKKRPRRRSRGHGGKKPADAQTALRAEHAAKEGAKDGAKEGAKPKQPQRQKSQSNRKPGARKPGDKPAGEHPERSRAQAPAAKPADGAAQSGEKRADNHRRRHRGGRGRNKSAAPGNAKPGNTAPDTPKAE